MCVCMGVYMHLCVCVCVCVRVRVRVCMHNNEKKLNKNNELTYSDPLSDSCSSDRLS